MEQNIKMWSFLIHLGSNMWKKKRATVHGIRFEEDCIYKEKMLCQRETWRKVTVYLVCSENVTVKILLPLIKKSDTSQAEIRL